MNATRRTGSLLTLALLSAMALMWGCNETTSSRARPLEGSDEHSGVAGSWDFNARSSELLREAGASSSFVAGIPERPSATVIAEPGDELWIIAKPSVDAQAPDEEVPGCGALMCSLPSSAPDAEPREVPLPLKHTEVEGAVSGYIASVNVRQEFHNPYDAKIEALYVFPLPQNAAVSEFIMTIGERRIRGIIREREEAERIYYDARSQGYVASLLTQERPNIFTQHVANIEPGREIDVDITYFSTLAYVDGWYEFVFPMVVGPRFNPPHMTDGIGAVPRGAHGISGQSTEVQYLAPNERSGHDIGLSLKIDAGVPIEEVVCPTHRVETAPVNSAQTLVTLSGDDTIPNRDFVLRYRVAGEQPRIALLTHRDQRGGFFTLMLYPPREVELVPRSPLEMVFVIDCSGSMSGQPLAQAKRAVEWALRHLKPEDTFQIIRFSDRASRFGTAPVKATEQNLRDGLRFVSGLNANGGTMMINGIRAALDFPHEPQRTRFVVFLTDGYIGNESEILGEIQQRLGPSRIFSFGVGSAVNRYLMERMAKLGRGVVSYVGLKEDPVEVMQLFVQRIEHPVLTDVAIDFGSMQADELYPRRMPDLFVGRPVVLTGRFSGSGEAMVRIAGRADGQRVEIPVRVNLDDASQSHVALPNVWARMQIADLSEQMMGYGTAGASGRGQATELQGQIERLALEYGLMSAYTAFVAVDSSRRTEGTEGTVVPVAVPVPEGVRYDTAVVGER